MGRVLIDNGHGVGTAGKCSPDGRLREGVYCRRLAVEIVDGLRGMGYDAVRIVEEDADVGLGERVRRVNEVCRRMGAGNVLVVSVHVNAAGNGGWHGACGWSGWVAPNAGKDSRRLAAMLYDEAVRLGLKGNRCVPKCRYWTGNFAMVRDTACAAVLTENLFMDNRGDVDFLLSDEGRRAVVDLHVNGISNYIEGVWRRD